MFSVQCLMFSVQCLVFSVQCLAFSVQCLVLLVERAKLSTVNFPLSTFNCQLKTNSGLCPETHSLFCLDTKNEGKKIKTAFLRSKNIVHELKRMQTRSDKSDLKQHSFLTAHFTAFFGYINEVAYLVDSGKWVVDSSARETLNEQRSTLNTQHFQLSTINYPLTINH